jgi:uncharacterized membrane protein
MLPRKVTSRHDDDGFRWRGVEVTRIEGLSDGVFAFAVTLLIVSLEVPKTFDELMAVMRGFPAFAICFALLLQVWHEQHRFFRRYSLQDSTSLILNCILLFLVLFYVYPLKFLFTFLINKWIGLAAAVQIKERQVPLLMEIFSAGFLAVSCIFMLLYSHALHRRDALELNALEVFDTKVSIGAAAINALTAIASLAIAWIAPIQLSGFSGIIYPILLCPGFTIYYWVMGSKRGRLARRLG